MLTMNNAQKGLLTRQSHLARLDQVRPAHAEPTEYNGVDLTQLQPRMKKFAKAYMHTWNSAEASRQAGYSASSGYRLLARQDVSAYMQMLSNVDDDDDIADAKEVLKFATDLLRRNLTEEVVTPDGSSITKGTSLKDAVSAMQFLGKFHGVQREVVDVNTEVNIVVDIDEAFKGLIETEEVPEPFDSVEGEFEEINDNDPDSFLDAY